MTTPRNESPPFPHGQPGSADPLVFLLTRAHAVYEKVLSSLLREHHLDRHLRPGLGNVLFALFSRDGESAGELSVRLGVPKSTMTGVITALEDSGIVETRPDERDHRVKRLWLTRRGRSLEPRCRQLTEQLAVIFAGDLSVDEIETFQRLLEGLLIRLRDAAERRGA